MLTGANVVGTPMYFAPEQTRSGISVGTNLDLWAVGVMIFHCVTGTLPSATLGTLFTQSYWYKSTKTDAKGAPRRPARSYRARDPNQPSSIKGLLRLYYGSIMALLRFYSDSIKALLMLYSGSIQALFRLCSRPIPRAHLPRVY